MRSTPTDSPSFVGAVVVLLQVYAEMTGFPLMELNAEKVKAFPRHGYGDMSDRTKRMVQAFAASKRMLLCDWNQGFRNTGDSVFVL